MGINHRISTFLNNPNVKLVAHSLGFSCMLVSIATTFWMFVEILFFTRFTAIHTEWMGFLIAEIGFSVYGFAYAFHVGVAKLKKLNGK